MNKKKVKELIQEVIVNNIDSLDFGSDKHNAPLRKANSLLHDALIELGIVTGKQIGRAHV